MSNLDEFHINYKIQVNAAIQNLTKLNNETAKTNKTLTAGAKGAEKFAEEVTKSLDTVVPGMSKLTSILRGVTAEFGLMTAGATVFTAAIANAMRVRAQFNEQRVQSRDAGVSAVRLEDWQRRMASGNVSRDAVARAVTGSQSFLRGAYADPSRLGPANRLLGMLGINPASGGAPITNTDFLTRLAARWHGQNDSTVESEAQMVGMDKDVALRMKEMGAAFGQIGMSLKEMQQYMDTAKNVHHLNEEMAKFNEQAIQLGETLGGPVLKAITEVLKNANQYTKNVKDPKAAASSIDQKLDADYDRLTGGLGKKRNGDVRPNAQGVYETDHLAQEHAKESVKKQAQQAADEQREKQKLADQDEKSNADFQSSVSQMELIINAFGASVAQFGHSISSQQVRAAWAGTVGLAGGISSSGHAQLGYGQSPGTIGFDPKAANAMYNAGAANSGQYDSIIKAAASKYGVPENVLKGIIGAESTWNPNAHSDSSFGLMGINKVNWKAYGLNDKNWNDPAANINAGAAIYAAMLKRAGGDQELGLRYYNGGFDKSKWGPQNAAYPGKVLGGFGLTGPQAVAMDPNYKGPWSFTGPTGLAKGLGESFESTQLKDLQATIAARAGVSLGQLQTRGASWGDVNFALQNYMSELVNSHYAIKQGMGAAGLTDIQRGQLMANLKTVDLQALNTARYAPEVLEDTRPGGRVNTIGQVAITVNGVAGQSAADIAREVKKELQNMLGSVVNSRATSVKQ
ncbi:transglycosylase SLT domain-containing protein [Paraburkholderia sp. A2WS-5]|uniref:transglycosylase SLT domain-containing protein n=1 Tax=unclassified Paraburkholderia TaxID=2615204 RepID=UPI003B762959